MRRFVVEQVRLLGMQEWLAQADEPLAYTAEPLPKRRALRAGRAGREALRSPSALHSAQLLRRQVHVVDVCADGDRRVGRRAPAAPRHHALDARRRRV